MSSSRGPESNNVTLPTEVNAQQKAMHDRELREDVR